MPFRELLATCTTRREVIVLFLALLELIKRGEAWAEQEAPFAEIVIVPA
jgi:chromatin segregation and condensation protein Rec8/ScpA/Scc1 (kleisin family)